MMQIIPQQQPWRLFVQVGCCCCWLFLLITSTAAGVSAPNSTTTTERDLLLQRRRQQAVRRLIRATSVWHNDDHSDDDSLPSWLEDWQLVLQGSNLLNDNGSSTNQPPETLKQWIQEQAAVKVEPTEQENKTRSNNNGEECKAATPQVDKSEEGIPLSNPDGQDNLVDQSESETQTSSHRHGEYNNRRHVQGILNVHKNYDCLESEFDVQSPDFDLDKARQVLVQCRILVVRNLYSKATVEHILLGQYNRYIQHVRRRLETKGRYEGTTSHGGGGSFILQEDVGRANYMIPQNLVHATPAVWGDQRILELLRHPSLLGDDLVVNHMGSVNANAGAPTQYWHADGDYVHGNQDPQQHTATAYEDEEKTRVVAGHDLPPFAINMFTPLLHNLTRQHGPTEFCLGTSHLRGLNLHDNDALLPSSNAAAVVDAESFNIISDLHNFEWHQLYGRRRHQPTCPEGFRRSPLLNMGDVLLFDYMVTHRGGPNQHKSDLRSMLFAMYSRKWYRDSTFDGDYSQEWPYDDGDDEEEDDDDYQDELARLTHMTRFAVLGKGDFDQG